MGLRQSKRSVDISGSPKKEFPAAAVVEKIPEANHGTEVEKVDEIIKPSTNGDTKLTETPELVSFFFSKSNLITNNNWFNGFTE